MAWIGGFFIGTTWDGRLCAFTVAGKHRWDAALGGFAFDVCCADLDGDGVDEILTAGADGFVGCFSADGRVLGAAHAPVSFTDVICVPGSPYDSIMLGSGLGGDDNLYRVTFDRGWQKQLAELPRSGQRKALGENLDQLARQAADWRGQPMAGAVTPIDVIVSHHMCLGFVSAEDEQAAEMAYYFEHQIRPLLEVCLARGKRFIPRNKVPGA